VKQYCMVAFIEFFSPIGKEILLDLMLLWIAFHLKVFFFFFFFYYATAIKLTICNRVMLYIRMHMVNMFDIQKLKMIL
jgi:hypothetical protein